MGGWALFGEECLLLSSEIIRDPIPGPKESCRKHKARAFPVRGPCSLQFYLLSPTSNISPISSDMVSVQFALPGNLWMWGHRAPRENCSSLKYKTEDGVPYAQCENRSYFACVQGQNVIDERANVTYFLSLFPPFQLKLFLQFCFFLGESPESKLDSPAVTETRASCGSIGIWWELPPMGAVCQGKLDYMIAINCSALDWSISQRVGMGFCFFTYGDLPRNKTYSVQLYPMNYYSGKLVGLPWRREVTVIQSGKTVHFLILHESIFNLQYQYLIKHKNCEGK